MQQIGTSEDLDRVFTQVCLLMANEPAYQEMPVKRLPELLSAIAHRKYLLMVESGDVVAVLLWQNLDAAKARRLAAEQRMPTADEITPEGDAFVLTSLVGKDAQSATRLFRHFKRERRGHIILYERHLRGKTGQSICEFHALLPEDHPKDDESH